MAEVPYSLAVRYRNWCYDTGRAKIHRAEVPVVCVGNLTLGGTGKTPMIAYLAQWFRDRDIRIALVSRGYKAESGTVNDEALELEQKLPGVPHVQNADRVAGAQNAIAEHDTQLVLLDDGFQHRRLARDVDLVMVDALEPYGFEHVIPRGTLREPLAGLSRAHIVALSRANLVDQEVRSAIRARLQPLAPQAAWIEVAHSPQALICASGQRVAIKDLSRKRVAAFCGIGNPQGFEATITKLGYTVCGFREYADHYAFNAEDIASLASWADELGAEALVCTHKDLVKLNVDQIGNRPLWALEIGMEVLDGREELERELASLLP